MLDFKAKMYQIQFRLGLRSRPRWGAYSAPPDSLAALRGPTSKGRGREEEGERKKEGSGKGEPRGEEGTRPHPFTPPLFIFLDTPLRTYRILLSFLVYMPQKLTQVNHELLTFMSIKHTYMQYKKSIEQSILDLDEMLRVYSSV